jgi:CAAX protease family protein
MNVFYSEDGRLRSGWRFAIAAVLVVAVNYLGAALAYGLADSRQRLMEIIFRPTVMIGELLGFFALARLLDKPRESIWKYNGLPRSGWLRESLVGALLGFVMVGLMVMVIAIFFELRYSLIRIDPFTLRTAFVVFLIILAAAMSEELAFRGYPFQRLVEGIGPAGAILVLSALFGAVHLNNPHVSDNRYVQVFAFSNTLLAGVLFAIAYLRTRALWFPWGLHFGWNATLGLFFGLPVSGINDFATVVHSRISGPEWLLGGAYGLEGGFLGTVAILLGLLYILVFVKPAQVPTQPEPAKLAELPQESIQPESSSSTDL